jgi:hypothetical protein
MELAPVLAQLQTVPKLAGRAAVAVSVEAALEFETAAPYAWLCQVKGLSGPNEVIGGGIWQPHEQRFGVLSLVQNVADMRGEAALADMTALRGLILTALLGFRPAGDYEPIQHVRDLLAYWDKGRLYWFDEFKTSHTLSTI